MLRKLCLLLCILKLVNADFFVNKINHMEYYRNKTRPSKAFNSFSTNYFNQNFLGAHAKPGKVLCGTRTIDFNPGRTGKIVGGTETPYGAFPWQVEIQMLDVDKLIFEHHCGGAVIAERLVLSAAHCFDKQPLQLDHIRLVVGEHRLKIQDKHEHQFFAEKVVPHPDFRKNGPHSNDIAIILVSKSGSGVQFNSHVRPICLPSSEETAGQWCAVSGWGYQAEGTETFAPVLRAASVPVLDLATCRQSHVLGGRQQPILDSMICAGILSGGVDACRGDSGGPLACRSGGRADGQVGSQAGWALQGVVSWGAGCARRARPGVYTRVASYIPWIRKTATKLGLTIPS
ncbi:trypsin-like [Bombyx mandarina]|uniref:Peptidase S1 domain-containing protein n=2 Tax=Bombyx TaxID=7090 RepID=A0A8R2AW60_BOMMO|nr:trypsin [Bombyx mori]XP_028042024.1 trypsin-like [Bombyx mandarina]